MGGEQSAAVTALSHFSHQGSAMYVVVETAVSVKVQHRMKTDRMAVFEGGGCAMCVPRTSDYGPAQD
jgi:hypothetical protein